MGFITLKNMMYAGIYLLAFIVGLNIQKDVGILTPIDTGAPKATIPKVGSVIHIGAVFEDGSFVGEYAGTRLYYKRVDRNQRLEPGRAYEVAAIPIQNSGSQISLVEIKGK